MNEKDLGCRLLRSFVCPKCIPKQTEGQERAVDADFPLRLYLCRKDGSHGSPVEVRDPEHLSSPAIENLIFGAIRRKVEILAFDPGSHLVFLAKGGRVYFDGMMFHRAGRVITFDGNQRL